MFSPSRSSATRPCRLSSALWLAALLAGCASTGEAPATPTEPVKSSVESDPIGATIFVDGGFVGTTPTAFRLPPKHQVHIRLELPGYFPVDTTLDRAPGIPEGAEPGVGWDPVYYFPLKSK